MVRDAGNTLRRSSAAPDTEMVNNYPSRYPTEDWRACYWTVTEGGGLQEGVVTVQLPGGCSDVCLEVEVGQSGCVHRVRRWGFACYVSLLEEIGFDPAPLLTHDRERFPGGDDQELLQVMIGVTHFDLPGHFIIASQEHPFLLFDPRGALKGSYTRWYTYLGALAYLTSDGRVQASFQRLWGENERLYQEALGFLLGALRREKRENQ
ncbi:MAG: hypothetical protein ACETWR_17220 [Anaerolineae bacterium]